MCCVSQDYTDVSIKTLCIETKLWSVGQQHVSGRDHSQGKSPSVIPAGRSQHGQHPPTVHPHVPSGASGSKVVQVPKLTLSEQQNLRQVNQRTDEMASIMAQIASQHGKNAGTNLFAGWMYAYAEHFAIACLVIC